jgi:hypothetical protein
LNEKAWSEGDVVEFLDIGIEAMSLVPNQDYTPTLGSSNGWGVDSENIQFVPCGLVGGIFRHWE